MLNVHQLRELIIKPTLLDLIMFNEDAMELLIFTCAVESNGGTYLKQIKGPALGIYQMEPGTYNDIWQNYIRYKKDLSLIMTVNFQCNMIPEEDRLIYDLKFATAMAMLHYSRKPEPIPSKDNINAVWSYYKKYYNTNIGAAEKDPSIRKYLYFLNN